MKLLSECAKAVALKQGDRTIAPRHMLAAMQHLQAHDGTEYLLFIQELKKHTRKALRPVFASDSELHTWLGHARQAPPMNLAPTLTRLISSRGGMRFALTQLPGTAHAPQPPAPHMTTPATPAPHSLPPPDLTLADVARVRQHLQATVLGQAAAIEALTDALAKSLYHAGPPAPLATFMLVGASATGKTHLAQQLAAALGPDWSSLHIQLGALTDPNHTAELGRHRAQLPQCPARPPDQPRAPAPPKRGGAGRRRPGPPRPAAAHAARAGHWPACATALASTPMATPASPPWPHPRWTLARPSSCSLPGLGMPPTKTPVFWPSPDKPRNKPPTPC
jgi:hypothetical protein